MQAGSVWLLRPRLLFVLSLSLVLNHSVRAEEVVAGEIKPLEALHMRVDQEEAVLEGLSVSEKEYEAFDQLMKTMTDIKNLFERDSQLNYETIQLIPTMDITAFINILRRATAAKFELLARLVEDVTGGVSRGTIAMLEEAQGSFLGGKKSGTTTTTMSQTSRATTTTTTRAGAVP